MLLLKKTLPSILAAVGLLANPANATRRMRFLSDEEPASVTDYGSMSVLTASLIEETNAAWESGRGGKWSGSKSAESNGSNGSANGSVKSAKSTKSAKSAKSLFPKSGKICYDEVANPLPATQPNPSRYTPGEFEELDAIFVGWPRYDYVADLPPMQTVVLEMLTALCSCQKQGQEGCTSVIVQAPLDILEDATTAIESANLTFCGITYQNSTRDDIWIRDMGPVFTKNGMETVLLDFNFDFWSAVGLGTPDLNNIEENLDSRIYAETYPSFLVEKTNLIGEGGNREFNGQGVLMMNRDTESLRNEKRTWTIERSEEEYKRIFGVTKILWVDGIPNNDFIAEFPTRANIDGVDSYLFNWGTGGHIDEIARFVSADTIVTFQISDEEVSHDDTGILARDQAILAAIKAQLEEAADVNGDPYNIIVAPAAPLYINELTEDDLLYSYWYAPLNVFQETLEAGKKIYSILATSYMNFVVTNKVVLIPKYYIKGDTILGTDAIKDTDKEFMKLMEHLYPDREVFGINPLHINNGGGGMHCIVAHKNM